MPVAAVALAATSFAAGATAFAAATTLAGSIAAGAMMVGSALSIVGTVTGNAKLAKIGGVLAIAGGLGTMAVNATAEAAAGGAADSMASTGGQMGDAGASAAAGGAAEGLAGSAGELANAATSGVEMGAVDLGGTQSYALEQMAPGVQEAGNSTGMLSQAQAHAAPSSAAAAAAPEAGMLSPTGAAGTEVGQAVNINTTAAGTEVGQAANTNWLSAEGGAGYANGMAADAIKDPGMMAKFEAWTKANPQTAKLLMEGGKGMLGSLVNSPKDQAMIDYYRANADQIKRRAMWGSGRIA